MLSGERDAGVYGPSLDCKASSTAAGRRTLGLGIAGLGIAGLGIAAELGDAAASKRACRGVAGERSNAEDKVWESGRFGSSRWRARSRSPRSPVARWIQTRSLLNQAMGRR